MHDRTRKPSASQPGFYFQRDAFSERSDVGGDNLLRSIHPGSLFGDQLFESQSSLSAPTNEDLHFSELAREAPALPGTLSDIIFKQHDFRQPVTTHAEAATRQLSLQPVPDKKMERSLAGYWCPEANSDAFSERSDLGGGISLRSICPGSLLDDQLLASQSSLSVSTNEDMCISDFAREASALSGTLNGIIFKQRDFRRPVTVHAEAATRQLSFQSVPEEKMERSLAEYWYPEANSDAFSERSDLGGGISLRSICPESLLDDQLLASQSSLSVPANEDVCISEFARTQPAYFETLCDMIFNGHDFQQPATLHAEAATRQLSFQSVPCERMECSLAGYWYPETTNLTRSAELMNQADNNTASCTNRRLSFPDDQYANSATVNNSTKGTAHSRNRTQSGRNSVACDYCGKSFTYASKLKDHMRIHTGEKPYECSSCNSSFTRKDHLQKHIRIHTGERLHSCEQCDKNFGRQDALRRHYKVHTGEKPYECSHCNSSFAQKSSLHVHMRIHTGERPYSCKQCGKNFGKPNVLRNHYKVRTGKKPYECSQCNSSFAQKNCLQMHTRIHTGEKL